jgi:hypothetical protein
LILCTGGCRCDGAAGTVARHCRDGDGRFGRGRDGGSGSSGCRRRHGTRFASDTSREHGLLVIVDLDLGFAVGAHRDAGGAIVNNVAIRSGR